VSVAAFLAGLRRRDIRVWTDHDRLRCNASAGVLTAELRDQLKRRKTEIFEYLLRAGALAWQQRAIVPLQPRDAPSRFCGRNHRRLLRRRHYRFSSWRDNSCRMARTSAF
jgi:hypothetical protein